MSKNYHYEFNPNKKEVTIFEEGRILATVSDIKNEKAAKEMFGEILYEKRGINVDEIFK